MAMNETQTQASDALEARIKARQAARGAQAQPEPEKPAKKTK